METYFFSKLVKIFQDHWNTFRIILSHTVDECFYVDAKSNDTMHVIYQVLKGGDSLVRVKISDPLGKAVFSQANSPFGWYDEENLKVEGKSANQKRICSSI